MKNNSNDTATFIWTSIEDSIAFNPFVISNSKELKLTVLPRQAINMSFGIGTWTPKEVERLIGKLTSFEIVSSAQKVKIDSLPLLKEYLLARRKGIGGSKIQIEVK